MSFQTRSVLTSVLIAGALGTITVTEDENSSALSKTQVMILGTYHFAQVDPPNEMFSAERQEQLGAVLDRLEVFAPDNIFLEAQPEFEYVNGLQNRYQTYRWNAGLLGVNEIFQIGFRLGRRLDLERLNFADHPGMYGIWRARVAAYAEAHGQEAILEGRAPATTLGPYELEDDEALYRDSTVLEYLLHINGPEYQRADHAAYLTRYPRVGDVSFPTSSDDAVAEDLEHEAFVGAELVADWYRRNLMIYSKIITQVDEDADRILVVFGNGHVPTLRHFFESNPHFEVVSAHDWLAGE